MERVTGYTADEVIGRKGVGILRARDVEGREVRLDQWAASEAPLPAEVRVLTRVDEERWLSFSYSAASAEAGEPLIVIARDITSARELERLREDFVATVSHEMRAPLSPIKGWASTLLQCGDDLKVEERRAALQSILQQAKRLEHLIASLLEVSRIEHGTFEVVEDQKRLDVVGLTGAKDAPPFYAVASGVEVKPLVKVSDDELLSLKIVKGVLTPSHRTRESKTYFVQNNSDEDRTFTVDHVVRKGYKRIDQAFGRQHHIDDEVNFRF